MNIIEAINKRREQGRRAWNSGNEELAGEYYLSAGNGHLMRYRKVSVSSGDPNHWPSALGQAIRDISLAGICFRMAERDERCESCCTLGITFINDLVRSEANEHPEARVGLFHETLGDLATIRDGQTCDQEYDSAANLYSKVDNDLGWSMEDELDYTIHLYLRLADNIGYRIEENQREQIYRTNLDERISFKRESLNDIISKVVDHSDWKIEKI